MDDVLWTDGLGERATLLQFSSTFCAPCRAARRVLSRAAATLPGVVHRELDVADHPELADRAGITGTPTTLILDSDGREVARAEGAPSLPRVLATLDRVLGQRA